MHKILVTGGLGFIGSHTAVELIDQGFEVIIIDDLSNSSIENLDRIESITGRRPEFERIDLRDSARVNAFFNTHSDITGAIHFAARKAVGESVKKPLLYYENNLGGMINLLKGMRSQEISNFIFSSSCTVYGNADELPITEDAPIKKAESPYGNTKQIGEEILSDLCRVDENFKVISLRYFNPIGAHPSGKLGELPLGVPENLIPYITQTAIGLRDQLSVFGDDYDTPDGTCIRDYIHVVDLARAHIAALKYLIDGKFETNYEVFNLGTGKGSSVMEVIKAFEKVSRAPLNYKVVSRRPGDVVAAYADTAKVNEKLGWKTELSMEEALRDAWKWEQNQRSNSNN